MTVLGEWPTYLLKQIPPEIRAEIEREAEPTAERPRRALIEVVRQILCAHYELVCDPVRMRGSFEIINGTPTMLLRLQPELLEKLRENAIKTDIPIRTLIIAALHRHYS